jgi:hypothetical protein
VNLTEETRRPPPLLPKISHNIIFLEPHGRVEPHGRDEMASPYDPMILTFVPVDKVEYFPAILGYEHI